MAAVSSIIAAVAIAAAVGGTVYSTETQKREARLASDKQENMAHKREKDLKDAETQSTLQERQRTLKARQKALSATNGGRQDTILTSPNGVVDSGADVTAGKTLLGS